MVLVQLQMLVAAMVVVVVLVATPVTVVVEGAAVGVVAVVGPARWRVRQQHHLLDRRCWVAR